MVRVSYWFHDSQVGMSQNVCLPGQLITKIRNCVKEKCMSRFKRNQMTLQVLLWMAMIYVNVTVLNNIAIGATGTVLCPVLTGYSEAIPFQPHEGWVDVYAPGDSTGKYTRITKNATFNMETPSRPVALIASFDHIDALPIILPQWPSEPGKYDISLWGDYICFPPGYPEVWDKKYAFTSKTFYQTFIARSTSIYAITAFDGAKVASWGNKVHGFFYPGGPYSDPIMHTHIDGAITDMQTAHHSDHSFPFIGFRHGDIPVTPGKRYAVCISGYRSHGGQRFDLPSYVQPKNGNGYMLGRAYTSADKPLDADVCLIVAGNSNGQIMENNIRSEEWDVRLPQRVPVKKWGQDFLCHGRSMAGLVFWACNPSDSVIKCKVRIREQGPNGTVIGPTKTAIGHECPSGPFIRYPDWPGPQKGYEEYYKLRPDEITGETTVGYYAHARLFQVAYLADEVKLEPGKRYYIDLEFSEPVLPIVDGDYYKDGFGYYDGQKMEKDKVFHSSRWTIAGQIMTYQNPAGKPNWP